MNFQELLTSGAEMERAGELDAAERLYKQALRLSDKFTNDDARRFVPRSKLAGLYLELGRYLECEAICRDVLRIVEQSFGDDSEYLVAYLEMLAMANAYTGRLPDARIFSARAVNIAAKRNGRNHPRFIQAAKTFAVIMGASGDTAFEKRAKTLARDLSARLN